MASLSALSTWLKSHPAAEPQTPPVEVHVDLAPLTELLRSMMAPDGSMRTTERVLPRP